MSRDFTGSQQGMGNYPKHSAMSDIASGVSKAFSDYSAISKKNIKYLNKYGTKDELGNFVAPEINREPSAVRELGQEVREASKPYWAGAKAAGKVFGSTLGRGVLRGGIKAVRTIQNRVGKGAGQSQEFDSLNPPEPLNWDD